MKIGLFAEGCYPYVIGGVSSWTHMLTGYFRQYDYTLYTITISRAQSGKFLYKLPPNVTRVVETYLEDDDIVRGGDSTRGRLLPQAQHRALRDLVLGGDIDWNAIFHMFDDPDLSIDEVLMGRSFLAIVTEYYERKYDRTIFTDFLWTIRSMYLPLFHVLKGRVEPADLYHTVSTGYSGMLAAKAACIHRRPLLLTEHGIYTREREEEIIKADWTKGVYKDLWIEFFYKLSSCCYQYAHTVVSLFESARTLQTEIGCPARKTRVIPNGIDTQSFADLPQNEERDGIVHVGSVLRIAPIKDVKTMITAFSHAKSKMPNLKMWLMGPTDEDEDYYQSCLELVKALQVQDIIFTGRVNVREYLGKMDIILLTSISEGQPLSLLEAMAARKPCIATRVGNCEGLLHGESDDYGECGIIAPIMNVTAIAAAIVRLAGDAALRARMGEIGLRRAVERYQHKSFLDQYRGLYEGLAKMR